MGMNAGFVGGTRGSLFCVVHEPDDGRPRGSVLYVHPFAEEHNKSRRMAAQQARALSAAGWRVVMPDLYGCGDSGGDFGDADWTGWLDDVRGVLQAIADQHPGPVHVWGLRAGCLLIAQVVGGEISTGAPTPVPVAVDSITYWQPVVNGEQFLTQFLRLRMSAAMMGGGKETTRELRARLDAGEKLEVAGYALSPGLAAGLAAARLAPPPAGVRANWLEVASGETADLSPASRKLVEAWRQAGHDVRAQVVAGEGFWGTQEIREVPELVTLTATLIAGVQP
ncbi:MAG: hydrolase 2, exosortase A system-associated [Rhodocyclaceae bacterium]